MGWFSAKDFLTGAALLVAGGIAHWLWNVLTERLKPIVFAADDWKLEYIAKAPNDNGQKVCCNEPENAGDSKYRFKVRFFNKKSKAVGIHEISLEFTRGSGWWRKVEYEDRALGHGPFDFAAGMPRHDDLKELTLARHEWTADNVNGHTGEEGTKAIARSDAVWLTASGTDGKKRRWLVVDLGKAGPSPVFAWLFPIWRVR